MSPEEEYYFKNEHDGFRREKVVDNPIFEPFLD